MFRLPGIISSWCKKKLSIKPRRAANCHLISAHREKFSHEMIEISHKTLSLYSKKKIT